ncbi:electron transfer flavoprotein-ubiquinone oxidoreductase [Thiobacillus denitrificans]|uniref:Electron transfer flavoprotein-ubiquinone oxidoreductase n=1 Tax=Thiobacillus denitrificans TaxID=36861 RepID=A0A106BNC0_THIDE|nr:electron transfer flavoprotein-ubiquinone oxidoreductase [Thiobacillus denitrificans]KVW95607.1 electron transfer flavoprotein-ubiquinone oxidoreductase [Thiobacillus denitrificans]
MSRDVMSYDVLIVGAGPAGLAAALRLKQCAQKTGQEISVCVLEKGAQVGAHILSGAVIDPASLNELIPDWSVLGAPLTTPVSKDEFLVLGERGAWRIPVALLPPLMANHGAYITSLGEFCQWLGSQAEAAGVEIYAGYAAQEILYGEQGEVAGVITGDMGRTANGEEGPQFAPGIEIHARYTLIAEGARGSLTRDLEQRFQLRKNSSPQKYGLGIKEVWRVAAEKHRPGLVQHSLGWPLASDTGGGSFIYHYGDGLVSIGFVVHLDYANPHLSPFDEFQRFKTHPAIRPLLEGGKRLSYGARAITEGGLQSWPELVFPGGALIGCSAGMVNVPRIKGIHNAMKSGMLAAEAVMSALAANRGHDCLSEYPTALRNSKVWRDLHAVRNVKPMLSRFGTVIGTLFGGVEMWLAAAGVRLPWTLRHQQADHECTRPASEMPKIDYPNPDGKISFDKLGSVALSNITHDRDQPCHLHLLDKTESVSISIEKFDAPEQRYCPAGVYELVVTDEKRHLQINAQNCIHCKTCDIKDALQNIVWKPPEGGSGPVYSAM